MSDMWPGKTRDNFFEGKFDQGPIQWRVRYLYVSMTSACMGGIMTTSCIQAKKSCPL